MIVIAVDFDGTVVTHDFPAVGKDIGAVPILKRLIAEGHRLILWTMRGNPTGNTGFSDEVPVILNGNHLDDAVNWFKENDIELYGIQRNPTQDEWTKSPKCYAQLYIDDAALGAPLTRDESLSDRAFIDWSAVEKILEIDGVLTPTDGMIEAIREDMKANEHLSPVKNSQVKKSAIFSPCGKYRYELDRIWDICLPVAMCVGLNPSTANHEQDDPTIRKITDILKYYGYGGFVMTNLYGIISSTTDKLYSTPDPLKDNDDHLLQVATFASEVFYCWGTFPKLEARIKVVRQIVKAAGKKEMCFGKTKHGLPVHPAFYVRRGTKAWDVPLQEFECKPTPS